MITEGTTRLLGHFLAPPLAAAAGCRAPCMFFFSFFRGADICVFLSHGIARENKLWPSPFPLIYQAVPLRPSVSPPPFGSETGQQSPPTLGPIRRYASPARLAEQILPTAAEPALQGRRRRGRGKVAVTRRGGEVTALVWSRQDRRVRFGVTLRPFVSRNNEEIKQCFPFMIEVNALLISPGSLSTERIVCTESVATCVGLSVRPRPHLLEVTRGHRPPPLPPY